MNEIEKLIEEYGDGVYRFCCNIAGSLFEAEDLFQDTFLKVMEHQSKVLQTENPKNYILGIAAKLEKNNQRKKNRRQHIAPQISASAKEEQGADMLESIAASGKSVEDTLIEKEQMEQLRINIQNLSRTSRLIAALYYGESLSIKEISRIVRIPQGTVKSRLYKIRQDLRKGLEGEKYER